MSHREGRKQNNRGNVGSSEMLLGKRAKMRGAHPSIVIETQHVTVMERAIEKHDMIIRRYMPTTPVEERIRGRTIVSREGANPSLGVIEISGTRDPRALIKSNMVAERW